MKLTFVTGLTVLGVVVQSLLLCIVTAGCSREVRVEDLPGTYVGDHNRGTDILQLKADGTLIHLVETRDGIKYVDTGTWVLSVDTTTDIFTMYRLDLNNYCDRFQFFLPPDMDTAELSQEDMSFWRSRIDLNRPNTLGSHGTIVSKGIRGVYIDHNFVDLKFGWRKKAP